MAKLGPENADTVKLHVRYAKEQDRISINGYTYANPLEWEKSEPENCLRFKEGVDSLQKENMRLNRFQMILIEMVYMTI